MNKEKILADTKKTINSWINDFDMICAISEYMANRLAHDITEQILNESEEVIPDHICGICYHPKVCSHCEQEEE